MADLRAQFYSFHEAIKLLENDENARLREKRDNVERALRNGLARRFKDEPSLNPTFEIFNQGSYAMGTGIKPINEGDYDIDVGLRFRVDRNQAPYDDPVYLKKLVCDVLQGHTEDVKIKRPCVTVNYARNYHVDLAIYASSDLNGGTDYLAKGFAGSSSENKLWEPSDARKFITLIEKHLEGESRTQFKRIIRYLKRWKNVCFRPDGNAAPVGIGLTISAYRHFNYICSFDGRPRDLEALSGVVNSMLLQFQYRSHLENGGWERANRICAELPVRPHDDVYDRISNKQMQDFEQKLKELKESLYLAVVEPDPHEAAKILREKFGPDFPIPPKTDTSEKSSRPAITHSSNSA